MHLGRSILHNHLAYHGHTVSRLADLLAVDSTAYLQKVVLPNRLPDAVHSYKIVKKTKFKLFK